MIAVKGLEKIDSALSREKGVVLLIAHFGSNRLVMPALGFRGYKINQVAGKPTEWIKILGNELSLVSRKILELEHENEQHLPANFIYVFRSMRPIFNCLKNNEIVCVAIDGGGGIRKEKIKFLGREAMISDGPFRIARKTGATILPAFIVRQQDDSHRLIIEDAILAESNLSKEEDNSNGLNNFMNILEQYVDQYPCHYALRLALGRMLMEKDPIPFFTDYKKEKTL
jgi:KDO2-lipid IV(A) lauroyltransferase